MNSKHIYTLIRKFVENDLPKGIQMKFRQWFIDSNYSSEKDNASLDIWELTPAIGDEKTAEDLEKIRQRISMHEQKRTISLVKRIGKVAAILLLPLLSTAITYYFTQRQTIVKEVELVECFVPYGEKKQLLLSDGSEVWINSGSLLIYAREFEGKTRTLFLNGEANFNVAKNPEKPFIVKTEAMDIEALGTVFNVSSYSEDDKNIATLESGQVRIITRKENPQSIILSPNEQLIYNKATKVFEKRKIDAEKYARWKQGFLVFQSSSFEEIINTIERSFAVTVNYEVNRFAGRTFTIRFSPEEDIHDVMSILKDITGFKYKIKGNIIYIN